MYLYPLPRPSHFLSKIIFLYLHTMTFTHFKSNLMYFMNFTELCHFQHIPELECVPHLGKTPRACLQLLPGSRQPPACPVSLHTRPGHFLVCFSYRMMTNPAREEVTLSECLSVMGMWAGDRWHGQVTAPLSASVSPPLRWG